MNQGSGAGCPSALPVTAGDKAGISKLEKGSWRGWCSRASLTLASGNRVGIVQ